MLDRVKRWLGRKPQSTPTAIKSIPYQEAKSEEEVLAKIIDYTLSHPDEFHKSGRKKRGL